VADSERTDAEWVRLAQTGDRAAYGELVRRHQNRIYRHLLHLAGSREEALELAQERCSSRHGNVERLYDAAGTAQHAAHAQEKPAAHKAEGHAH
jgi:DNA-directed RNA polymerase specialized sigma24 family protein